MIGRLRGWLGSLRRRRPAPAILMYHRVAHVDCDPWDLAVAPQAFEAQISQLARSRCVLPLEEFVGRHRNGRLPSNAVALTFDDGCVCSATTAAPVLRRYGLPATFFLATGMIGNPEEFWWDRLERIVFDPAARGGATLRLGSGDIHVDLGDEPEQPDEKRRWRALAGSPATPRQRAYMTAWTGLKHRPAWEQAKALSDLAGQLGSRIGPRPTHIPMSVEQARSLAATPGLDIGGHTVDHVSLPGVAAGEQARQIHDSRLACEEWAGRPCRTFAYPYGDLTPTTRDLAQAAGLSCAVSTRSSAVARVEDPWTLPRIAVTGESVFGRVFHP